MFTLFKKHTQVGVCHHDQNIGIWEPNFWNLALEAINGNRQPFEERFRESHPFLSWPSTYTEAEVFALWDHILEVLGPVVFDKSPQYINAYDTLELIWKYHDLRDNVKFFGLIRDPKDAITSQWTKWAGSVPDDSPKSREQKWLKRYGNLNRFKTERAVQMPILKYEDLVEHPETNLSFLMNYLGINFEKETIDHLKNVNSGRFYQSNDPDIRKWRFGEDFKQHLVNFGYSTRERNGLKDFIKTMSKAFRG